MRVALRHDGRPGAVESVAIAAAHMLFDGQPDRPWGDAPRRNQLVFIGRNLDEQSMRRGFEGCLI